jgi:hypothetical protein
MANLLRVAVTTESGCSFDKMEFSLWIYEIIQGCIDDQDYGLAHECIVNEIKGKDLPEEGTTDFILEETGEWEDVFWHKYYVIKERIEGSSLPLEGHWAEGEG